MNIVGIGVDLVDVQRVEGMLERHPTFPQRVFTAEEIAYCDRQASPAEPYAARWAARGGCAGVASRAQAKPFNKPTGGFSVDIVQGARVTPASL